MADARGVAHARAALAGNPSDGYEGAVLAVTLDQLGAEALARRGEQLEVEPPSELVAATVRRFSRELEPMASQTEVQWSTSIPRGVGLGGSSAIVIAVLRALSELHRVELEPVGMAELALAVETEDLGVVAGLQDRIAQAFEGLVFMDFGAGVYEQMDVSLLPPLVIAWRADAAQESGDVHASLRARFEAGEREVQAAMAELGELARTARQTLLTGNRGRFAHAVDSTFAVRRRLLDLDPRHLELIDGARALGVGANYTGSGGAIVAVCIDGVHADGVRRAFAERGCGTLRL